MIERLSYIMSDTFDPYHNLALEEALLSVVRPGQCILYLWQNQNTVVIGKNQNAWKECKVAKLEEDGGHLARRLSGGGAVFHDLGNLNFTFIVHREDYSIPRQLDVILDCMRALGLQAEKSGRNDVVIDGRKFSGNAFLTTAGACYHHGTLLVDVDMGRLSEYLNVSVRKLQSKGVDSVRSRVVNLTEFLPGLNIDALKGQMVEAFGRVYGLTPGLLTLEGIDPRLLAGLEEKYASFEWRLGRKIPFEYECSQRFDWGEVTISLGVNEGRVQQAQVHSDSMEPEVIDLIAPALTGLPFSSREMCANLKQLSLPDDIFVAKSILMDIIDLLEQEHY